MPPLRDGRTAGPSPTPGTGSDAPTTWVLLPGMDGTGQLFGPLIASTTDACTPISYPDEPLDYDALHAHVRASLPDGPFAVIAESFSGPIGIRLAADPPAGLTQLVLVATFAWRPRPALLALLARPALFAIPPPATAIRALLTGRDADDQLVDQVRQAMTHAPASVLAHRARQVLSVDAGHLLGAIDCPITYLRATRDRMVPPSAMERLRAARPDMRCVDIRAPHLLLQCAPTQAWQAIHAENQPGSGPAGPRGLRPPEGLQDP